MKKVIKLTESKLISLIERVLNEGTVLKYDSPLPAEISKSLDKKGKDGRPRQNVFKIVTKNTPRYYSIKSVGWSGTDELNFQKIKKKSNGDLEFYRWVKDGVDMETIKFSVMSKVITDMSNGKPKIHGGGAMGVNIYFYKL